MPIAIRQFVWLRVIIFCWEQGQPVQEFSILEPNFALFSPMR